MTNPDRETILENLVEEFLARVRAGETPSIESFSKRHPEIADEIEEMLTSIAMMEQLSHRESSFREHANASARRASAMKQLGDFDIVREIGRGGMGVVYEAVDRTLGRRVALKVLKDSALTTEKHVDRFRRESRLAAQLHHTNIVSVYGVGEDEQKHFYAMQYVEGISIQEILDGLRHSEDDASENPLSGQQASVIQGLRAGAFAEARSTHSDVRRYSDRWRPDSTIESSAALSDTSTAGGDAYDQTVELSDEQVASLSDLVTQLDALEDPPTAEDMDEEAPEPAPYHSFGAAYWHSVARIGTQVADALHYAHVNGILHRDIKPANLLFDQNGTVWVADFGLAKLSESDDLTNTGDAVGTLKYMAPEQLAGRADARTDIYALGLTLYELLTLQPVCDGENYKDIFAQKQDTNAVSLRPFNPSIPRDLETIVQKALAWEPNRRYASARELSDDLQRFLDDRPVRARPVTSFERAWRWCRRNRVVATLGALALGLFLTLPIVLGWAVYRQNQQNKRMETTLKVVLTGFDDLFGAYLANDDATSAALADASSGDNSKLATAMLTKDTAVVMEKMLSVYDQLAAANDSSTNRRLANESAKARRRVGDLYQRLGQFSKAVESYQEAADRYYALSERDDSLHIEVARTQQAMGAVHEQRLDFPYAWKCYELALDSLAKARPNAEHQYEQAKTHYLLGKRQLQHGGGIRETKGMRPGSFPRDHGQPNDASEHLVKATTLLTELRNEEPDNAEYRYLLALCLREDFDDHDADRDEACIRLLSELVEQFPQVTRYRFALCETYLQDNSEDPNQRINRLTKAKDLGESLVKEQRNVASYRINLAHIYAFLGVEFGQLNDICQAEAYTRQAISTHKSVVKDFPGLAPLSNFLAANDVIRLGDWLLHMRRYEELIELVQPLGDDLYEDLQNGPGYLSVEDARNARMTLMNCHALLLPAFNALRDEVGMFVIREWLRGANAASPFPGPRPGPGGRGPGPGGRDGGPFSRGPAGRKPSAGPFGQGPPSEDESHYSKTAPLEMALSYDRNDDGDLTRTEIPPKMAIEWFERLDTNNDSRLDLRELSRLTGRRPQRPGPQKRRN